jgi:hypothetical protein
VVYFVVYLQVIPHAAVTTSLQRGKPCKLAVTPCKDFWEQASDDQYRLKHKWHSPEELFHLREGQIKPAGHAKSRNVVKNFPPQDEVCVVVGDASTVEATLGGCRAPASKFVFAFDHEVERQTLTFRDQQTQSLCLTADGEDVAMRQCSESESQQFVVSYAGNGLAIDVPEPTKFKTDQGPAWGGDSCHCDAVETKDTRCCATLSGWQRAADYFSTVSTDTSGPQAVLQP